MIARKITYHGHFDTSSMDAVINLSRKLALTGEIRKLSDSQLELNLEGDPSMIKLIQHQIERRIKGQIQKKDVGQIPYQYYQSLTFFP